VRNGTWLKRHPVFEVMLVRAFSLSSAYSCLIPRNVVGHSRHDNAMLSKSLYTHGGYRTSI
jgi:hypothetical protein